MAGRHTVCTLCCGIGTSCHSIGWWDDVCPGMLLPVPLKRIGFVELLHIGNVVGVGKGALRVKKTAIEHCKSETA